MDRRPPGRGSVRCRRVDRSSTSWFPQTLDMAQVDRMGADGRVVRSIGFDDGGKMAEPADLDQARRRIAELERIVADQRAELGLLRLQLEMLSSTDVITGLPNLTGMVDVVGREIARSRRTGEALGVMLVEIPALRGLDASSEGALHDALRHCGAMIAAGLRQSDTVGRMDDRTFVAVLPSLTRVGAGVVVGRIDAHLRTVTLGSDDEPVSVAPVFSIVLAEGGEHEAVELVEAAARARREAAPGSPAIVDAPAGERMD